MQMCVGTPTILDQSQSGIALGHAVEALGAAACELRGKVHVLTIAAELPRQVGRALAVALSNHAHQFLRQRL